MVTSLSSITKQSPTVGLEPAIVCHNFRPSKHKPHYIFLGYIKFKFIAGFGIRVPMPDGQNFALETFKNRKALCLGALF